jgi:DNA-binding FadR family transcriptional regulator
MLGEAADQQANGKRMVTGMATEAYGTSSAPEATAALPPEAEKLLLVLRRSTGPVGARQAARSLAETGAKISEASVSRVLSHLDSLGLTEPVGRKGRVLTEQGGRHVARRLSDQRRNADFSKALDIQTMQQLLDWLHARRGVECEVVRAVAERAGDDALARLEELLAAHEKAIDAGADPTPVAMRFHTELAQAADSPLLRALATLLQTEELAPMEQLLDTITGGHGTMGRSTREHESILEALRARDPDAAERAMRAHLDRLITEVDEFARGDLGGMLPRLLRLIR